MRFVATSFVALALCAVAAAVSVAWAQVAPAVSSGAEVVLHALSLLGVPYRLGGDDPAHGLDCSGLVQHVFRRALGKDLPRQSEAISEVGRSVATEALAPGDLLFFNTLGKPFSHVALYIGEGRFVHAPARGGQVRIESMQLDYWRARYNGARRIATDLDTPVPAGPGASRGKATQPTPGEASWTDADNKP